jgi:hypothetical protein
LACLAALLPHLAAAADAPGVAAQAYRHDVQAAPETSLMALGVLICGANSVADAHQTHLLHQVLLDCPAEAGIEERFPVRGQVLRQVQTWSVASRTQALTFLLGHRMAVTNFNALVMQLVGPPPTFRVIAGGAVAGLSDDWSAQDRAQLSSLLQKTWREAHLDAMWRQLSPAWQADQISPYKVRQVAQRVQDYIHAPQTTPLNLTYVTVNPLMPAGSGVTSIFSDNHYAIILGPSASEADAETLLAHELAHPIINAFFHTDARAQRALQNAACVFDAVRQDPQGRAGMSGVYTAWDVYFSETLVRSISHHIMQTTEAADGFILQPTVAWELQRYDANHCAFEELMVRSLTKLQGTFCHQNHLAQNSRYKALRRYNPAHMSHWPS